MIFLVYTLIAWVANAGLAKILYISIQPGQWLDSLLDWQNKLQQWDLQGKQFLAKAGGLCELCFSHAITFICFWMYVFFINSVHGAWISSQLDNQLQILVVNFIWYITYITIGTMMSLYFITKLFEK